MQRDAQSVIRPAAQDDAQPAKGRAPTTVIRIELARRVEQQHGALSARVAAAFRLTLARDPNPIELAELSAYAAKHGLPQACRLLFNTNEFVFVD